MFSSSVVALRGIAIAVALILGLSAAPQAFAAQDAADQIPEGLVDGASIEYTNEEDFTTVIVNVFQFEDEAAAASGLDALIETTTSTLSDVSGSTGDGGTPAAEAEVTELTDVEGLDEIADGAQAYEVPFGEGVSIVNLFVLDGANVHYWANVTVDVGSVEDADTTPEATPGAGAPIDFLVGIATPWFDGGIDREAELVDQLPTVDELPDGYTESNRQESLELGG